MATMSKATPSWWTPPRTEPSWPLAGSSRLRWNRLLYEQKFDQDCTPPGWPDRYSPRGRGGDRGPPGPLHGAGDFVSDELRQLLLRGQNRSRHLSRATGQRDREPRGIPAGWADGGPSRSAHGDSHAETLDHSGRFAQRVRHGPQSE